MASYANGKRKKIKRSDDMWVKRSFTASDKIKYTHLTCESIYFLIKIWNDIYIISTRDTFGFYLGILQCKKI